MLTETRQDDGRHARDWEERETLRLRHVILDTDCLWCGWLEWVMDSFKRFQITDEMCETFGYAKLTKEDKAKIFGLNAAKIYNVDIKKKRNALPAGTLDK